MGSVFSKPDMPEPKPQNPLPPEKQKKPLKRKSKESSKQRKKKGVKSLTIPMGGTKNSKSGVGIPKG